MKVINENFFGFKVLGGPRQNFALVTNFETKKIIVSENFLSDYTPQEQEALLTHQMEHILANQVSNDEEPRMVE
jgi:hypothetical protein